MIVGRIRTIDLASRLHGDEFAIFVSNTTDYSVAGRIISDINHTIEKEAKKRNMPSITLSAGAVIAHAGTISTRSPRRRTNIYIRRRNPMTAASPIPASKKLPNKKTTLHG